MNALLCIAVLTLLVRSTTSATMKLQYKCILKSKTIDIELLHNEHDADAYYGGASAVKDKCEYGMETHSLSMDSDTCGITLINDKIYHVDLKTTTNGVFTSNDAYFKIKCNFNADQIEQVIRVDPITVADKDSEAGTDVFENIKLELYKDGTSVTKCGLGEAVRLRAELTVSKTSLTKVIKVKSCSAKETIGKEENSVIIIDGNGCNTDVISILADKGFERVSTDVDSYVSQTVKFPCFKLPQTEYVYVKCIAVYLKSGASSTCNTGGRRKREVSSARGGNLMLLIKVLPDNSTLSTRTTLHSDDVCDHRSYLIGLVILGCVLALTVIVTVGMFVVIKRGRHGHESDQTAYANKGMS